MSNIQAEDTGADGLNFKVLKWKTKADSSVIHHFFVKSHSVKEPNSKKPIGRTLFVINVPPFLTKGNLIGCFHPFGVINEVYIHQKPTSSIPEPIDHFFPQHKDVIHGYKIAYIVFEDPKSVNDIMAIIPDDIDPLLMGTAYCGLKSWITKYNGQIVNTKILETNVRKFMEKFEKQELRRKEEEKNDDGQPDEDGWVTVTRKGKRAAGGTVRTEVMQNKLTAKKRRFEKQLLNFTPTQIKETRAKQLEELKKKFEEDKQRVSFLKTQRRFKPY